MSVILLAVPLVGVFYGWSELQTEIVKGKFPVWRRVAASVGIFAVTAQSFLFVALLITIFRYSVPFRVFLSDGVFAELVLLLFAAPCTFAWRGRVRWWLLASSLYLPVISFFSGLAVLAY
jgi:hypothetical protein